MPKIKKSDIEDTENAMPIFCVLNYSDGNIEYRQVCPSCNGRLFVPTLDRSAVVCSGCLSVVHERVDGARTLEGIEWKI